MKIKDKINFGITIKPRYSDLDGINFGISLIEPHNIGTDIDQWVNTAGTILANLKHKFQNYVYTCTTSTILMKDGTGDEKDYLQDNIKIRKFLKTKILERYNPFNLKTGILRYTLQEHLLK